MSELSFRVAEASALASAAVRCDHGGVALDRGKEQMSSERHAELLNALLGSSKPISGVQLSRMLGVSDRTVRQRVAEINKESGCATVVASRAGYLLDAKAYARSKAGLEDAERKHDTARQRLFMLGRALLSSPDGIDVFDAADSLYVSPSTLEGDLVRLREVFRENNLRLLRDRDRVSVEGTERRVRLLLRQFLLGAAGGISTTAADIIRAHFPGYSVPLVRGRVCEALARAGFEINDYALNDTLLHMVIAAERVKAGRMYPDADEPHYEEDSQNAQFSGVLDEIQNAVGVVFPPAEREALTLLLASRVTRNREEIELDPAAVEPEVLVATDEAIDALSVKYGLLFTDERAKLSMALHIQGTVRRCRDERELGVTFGDGFRTSHPLIHELALDFSRQLGALLSIRLPNSEVDLIALHLGTQLQSQLEEEPPVLITCVLPRFNGLEAKARGQLAQALGKEAVIEKLITVSDLNAEDIKSDIVVASTPAPAAWPTLPVLWVDVSPLMTADDIERVRKAVAARKTLQARRRLLVDLATLSDPRFFRRTQGGISKDEALQIMCREMNAAGVVPDSFHAEVLHREELSTTAFGGQFALPHSMKLDASESAISVLVCEEPIEWGQSKVRLVVLLAMAASDAGVLRDFLNHFTEMLMDGHKTSQLINRARDYTSFISAINDLLDG